MKRASSVKTSRQTGRERIAEVDLDTLTEEQFRTLLSDRN